MFLYQNTNQRQTLQIHWTEHWNKKQKSKIKLLLAGWIENPIKSVVLTFPIDKIVFPTVTLCPQDSRPDRWGTTIKIFDQLNTNCGSKRWDFLFNLKANDLIWYSLQRFNRVKKITLNGNISFQLRDHAWRILFHGYQIVIRSPFFIFL